MFGSGCFRTFDIHHEYALFERGYAGSLSRHTPCVARLFRQKAQYAAQIAHGVCKVANHLQNVSLHGGFQEAQTVDVVWVKAPSELCMAQIFSQIFSVNMLYFINVKAHVLTQDVRQ